MKDPIDNIQKGLISVIIPAYNSMQWIDRAIQSVLNQTYQSIEIIVVVSYKSTDGTFEHVKSHYPGITVIKQTSGGISAARNLGAMNSHGEFLTSFDSDDIMVPQKLEIQLSCLQNIPDWGLCTSDTWTFDASEAIGSIHANPIQQKVGISFIDFALLIKKGNLIVASSVLVKREVFFQVGGYDENLHGAEDYDLWLKIAAKWRVVMVQSKLVWYQITSGSLSEDKITMKLDEIAVLKKWEQVEPEIVLPALRRDSLSLTRKLLRVGKEKEAREVFKGPYLGKKGEWYHQIQFSLLSGICKLHASFFSDERKAKKN